MASVLKGRGAAGAYGYTLLELMVSITIGLIVLACLVTLFAGNSRQRGEIERANEQTENGRFALQLLSDDLRDAGYLGSFNPGTVAGPNPQLVIPTALPNVCATDVPTLNSAIALSVQGYDDGASVPACLADVRVATDILVVRRASTCAVGRGLVRRPAATPRSSDRRSVPRSRERAKVRAQRRSVEPV